MPKKNLREPKPRIQPKLPVKKLSEERKIETRKIDASGQILGRLATQVANLLRGKDKPNFRPYLAMGAKVIVANAANIRVTGSKMTDKIYYRHSGYLGNLKSQTMKEIYQKNPAEIIRRAVWGMLPKNKLRKHWMKNLQIFNGEQNA